MILNLGRAPSIAGRGLANGRSSGIKILGEGDLTRKLTVSAHAFSAAARSKIEKLGGVCELVVATGASAKGK